MSSRIKKAQQICEGKSEYKTEKYLREKVRNHYLDIIKNLHGVLPRLIQQADNNQCTIDEETFDFMIEPTLRCHITLRERENLELKSIFFIKQSYNKSEMVFNINRGNLLFIENGENLCKLIEDIIKQEKERRKTISALHDIKPNYLYDDYEEFKKISRVSLMGD